MKGEVWKFQDQVDIEHIIRTKYEHLDPRELGSHCMELIDPEFSKKIRKGDFIVAGRNFGTGPGHHYGNVAIKECGIAGVIAESFARQFYRHSICVGLPVLICKDISKKVSLGDEIEVDFETGAIINLATEESMKGDPLPEFLLREIESGGLLSLLGGKWNGATYPHSGSLEVWS
jgi:3-isopropylmalate/(R)-2-methylmalate dehydratase small subunit